MCRRLQAKGREAKNKVVQPPNTQICRKCKEEKPWTEYSPHSGFSTGIEARCKVCKRRDREEQKKPKDPEITFRDRIKCLYGLSVEDYIQILEDQDYKCPICLESHTEDRKLFIDHIHYRGVDTPNIGKVRGLLCNRCNSVIGSMQERVEWFESAIRYLKKNKLYGGRKPKT